eukprot:10071637-Alexandrium_andersonii.AAC.1
MSASLVGSEMCIRDSPPSIPMGPSPHANQHLPPRQQAADKARARDVAPVTGTGPGMSNTLGSHVPGLFEGDR